MKSINIKRIVSLAVFAVLSIICIHPILAQDASITEEKLLTKVAELDSLYFSAHNDCDLSTLRNLLAPDLKAYHDIGGYTNGRENFMELMEKFCSNPQRSKRILTPGTLEVYPIQGVGVIQMAAHSFYRLANDKKEDLGSAKMINLWEQQEDNKWVISTLFSYNHQPPVEQPITQMIDIDGHKMRVKTLGLQDRSPGEPVVILEGGALSPIESWDPIFKSVAEFSPVLAYDRAGIGQSEFDGHTPIPQHVNKKLHDLLTNMEIKPPYILVGHSWGGPLIHYFAGRYPDEIEGLVFIDPTRPSKHAEDDIKVFENIGVGQEGYDAFTKAMKKWMGQDGNQLSKGGQAEKEAIDSFIESDPVNRQIPSLPHVPTAIIIAGNYQPPPDFELDYPLDFDAWEKATVKQNVDYYFKQFGDRPEVTLTLATGARHYVHGDDPNLVISSIRDVTFASSDKQLEQENEEDTGS